MMPSEGLVKEGKLATDCACGSLLGREIAPAFLIGESVVTISISTNLETFIP